MKRTNSQLEVGRIFFIPVGSIGFCASQILIKGMVFYIGVDIKLLSNTINVDCDSLKFSMYSWTTDAEIWKRNWLVSEIIIPIPSKFYKPDYLIQRNGIFYVESFDGQSSRPMLDGEDKHLGYRISRSPIAIQNALEAHHGLAEWTERYQRMLSTG